MRAAPVHHPWLVEQHDDDALIIYTDGSCLSRPRRGGYAFRLVTVDDAGNEVTHDFNPPGRQGATNNEMELTACVEALKLATGRRSPVAGDSYRKIVVYTDSVYVHDNVYNAEAVWPGTRWMTRDGEPVMSPDLWKDLVRFKQRAGRVEFRKVKAHKANPHNKAVDRLAKESARAAAGPMRTPREARRKTSPRRTERGSVRIRGQVETIRIVARRDISGQPHHVYKYEVVDVASEDFEAVDDAFAPDGKVELRPHHTYRVRFGAGPGRWIDEVVDEVEPE
jgi:ribonuclease HI